MIKQNTPEWLEMRRSYLGASDAPIVMGESPWMTKFQLWEEKLGLREPPQTNAAMRRGHELEPIAREAYEKYTGNKVEPTVVFHSEHKFLMASLDGLSSDGETVVEIKCPGEKDHSVASNGMIPEKYRAQLMHQLYTIDKKMVHYFSYKDGEFHLIEVERDDDYIKKLLKEELGFWKKVQNWEAPELCDKDFVKRDDREWSQQVSLWQDAKENLNFWEKQEKDHRKALIELSAGQSTEGCGVRLTRSCRKGSVDYKAIPELEGVDLDRYRKESSVIWRLS